MEVLYDELIEYLREGNKEKSVKLCISALESKSINLVDLYEKILTPALNGLTEENETDTDCQIWREHLWSGIVRTIVECSYPYVLKERDKMGLSNKGRVLVMCPKLEDHELGARMVSDFFTIAGYESMFVGANTPVATILKAIDCVKPKYISISVTNHFNLVATKKTIDTINKNTDSNIKFILGGSAFFSDEDMYKKIGGHLFLKSYNDILNLKIGDDKN